MVQLTRTDAVARDSNFPLLTDSGDELIDQLGIKSDRR
jgi:hypothetical protein